MWQMHTKILYSTDNSDDTQTNICTNMHSKRTEKKTLQVQKNPYTCICEPQFLQIRRQVADFTNQ